MAPFNLTALVMPPLSGAAVDLRAGCQPLAIGALNAARRGDGGIDGRSANLLLGRMRLKASNIFGRRGIRRTVEEGGELAHMPNAIFFPLCLKRRAVLSSIMRWADGNDPVRRPRDAPPARAAGGYDPPPSRPRSQHA